MTMVRNRKLLTEFTASAYPHMESKARDKVHRNTYKVAFPIEFQKSVITVDQLSANGIEVGNISDFVKDDNG